MIWNDLNEIIKNSRSFLISSHESQDGDNIGSQLAFFKFLKNLGKEVYIYNKEKTPQKFCFLPNSQEISDVAPNKKYDVLVILDSSNPQRCGIDQIETKFADKIVNIDHHRDNSMFGDVNCVDAKSAAACKILYDFFTQNDINIDCDMANCLLGGILTDTCGFQFNNDDGSLYLLADDLLKRGADNALLFKKLFSSGSIAALKVRAKIWETLEFYANDKISVISMPKSLISEYGADNSATEGMSNAVMSCEGVEAGIFVKYDEEEVVFSLRSSGKIDVGKIAESFEVGGGHKFAAGCTLKGISAKEATRIVLDKISQQLFALD